MPQPAAPRLMSYLVEGSLNSRRCHNPTFFLTDAHNRKAFLAKNAISSRCYRASGITLIFPRASHCTIRWPLGGAPSIPGCHFGWDALITVTWSWLLVELKCSFLCELLQCPCTRTTKMPFEMLEPTGYGSAHKHLSLGSFRTLMLRIPGPALDYGEI